MAVELNAATVDVPCQYQTCRRQMRQKYAVRQNAVTRKENCALPGYYAAGSGKSLLTFRYNLSVPSSGLENPFGSLITRTLLNSWPLKVGPRILDL